MILASQKRIGAFRTPRGPKTKKTKNAHKPQGKSARERRPGMSAAHCDAIRRLPCCITGRMPAGTIHHLKQGTGERGMGLRASDRWGVPLCPHEHEELERAGSRNELAWFAGKGIDNPIALAVALWAASPDVPRMTAIVVEHRGKR